MGSENANSWGVPGAIAPLGKFLENLVCLGQHFIHDGEIKHS